MMLILLKILRNSRMLAILSLLFTVSFCLPNAAYGADSEPVLGLSDDELLETIQRASFEFFNQEVNRRTGLVPDRAYNDETLGALSSPASIAATGFGLASFCVAASRGWVDQAVAKELARRTFVFFLEEAPEEHGFFYHFMNPETGKRTRNSELSPIDTALFLAGVLFAADYYDDPELRNLALQIYERVDFPWMLNKGDTFALAWSPEQGFSKYRWDHYNESMILYLLAIGSPTHAISAESWKAIRRPEASYKGFRLIQMPPLFTHQYSHIFIDFKNKNDGFADYFQNSVQASLANRRFAIDQSGNYRTYGADAWGITASDGPFGYKAYGAPPGWATHDGTIAPTGCGASIVFTPKESIACLRQMYEKQYARLWGRYGFSDSYNLDQDWFDDQVISIDQGALVLMIENFRSGLIWKTTAKNPYLNEGMRKVGFVPGTKKLPWPKPPLYTVPHIKGGIKVDGFLKDWFGMETLRLDQRYRESGFIENDKDLSADVRFAWDDRALYFSVKVHDDDFMAKRQGRHIWMDDIFELYMDPAGDGLFWGEAGDYQMG
ncbi:MAG: hypothetical protein COW12_11400, partial [Candidatus Omnitrophica bacterium CG12_big_fil_rev_8_21_14_0_65_45_16]